MRCTIVLKQPGELSLGRQGLVNELPKWFGEGIPPQIIKVNSHTYSWSIALASDMNEVYEDIQVSMSQFVYEMYFPLILGLRGLKVIRNQGHEVLGRWVCRTTGDQRKLIKPFPYSLMVSLFNDYMIVMNDTYEIQCNSLDTNRLGFDG